MTIAGAPAKGIHTGTHTRPRAGPRTVKTHLKVPCISLPAPASPARPGHGWGLRGSTAHPHPAPCMWQGTHCPTCHPLSLEAEFSL